MSERVWTAAQLAAIEKIRLSAAEAKRTNTKMIFAISNDVFPEDIPSSEIMSAAGISLDEIAFNYHSP